jgi:hypothetical protein
MEELLQWKASYCRSDGSRGIIYFELANEPKNEDLMDFILRWDTDHVYLTKDAGPDANRHAQAEAFFDMNQITAMRVTSLDDDVDSSSDA